MRGERLFIVCASLALQIVMPRAWPGLAAAPISFTQVAAGALNHAEGEVTRPTGSVETHRGLAEILVMPGVYFRLPNNSTASLLPAPRPVKGRALVEVAYFEKPVPLAPALTITSIGIYLFDADRKTLSVYSGKDTQSGEFVFMPPDRANRLMQQLCCKTKRSIYCLGTDC